MRIRSYHSFLYGLLLLFALAACRKEELPVNPAPPDPPVIPETPEETPEPPQTPVYTGTIFPADLASPAKVYIETPRAINSKHTWVELCSIRIVGDGGKEIYQADSLKMKGRGNTTWYSYPKKPYTLKLKHQADFFGTGKSRRYVLLANWMDRTLLRNDVAFEAARRTSLEWTPTGTFVELYLNGNHQGNYWLGEKINVEGSKFTADYLFTFDRSDESEIDFFTPYGFSPNSRESRMPVEIKYPDRDDYAGEDFQSVQNQSYTLLEQFGKAVQEKTYADMMNVDSFCDWYLIHELCYNLEPNHPKSCFIHVRDGVFIAGPVWDFDWYTFIPDKPGLDIRNSLYFRDLLKDSAFKDRLKERWKKLSPEFRKLDSYIDGRADFIRSSEAINHAKWPIDNWVVNRDEHLSFQTAVDRLKKALSQRIDAMDKAVDAL